MANSTEKNTVLEGNKSVLSDNYGLVMADEFKTEMIDNLYAENTHKFDEIDESQFVRTNDHRTMVSKLTVDESGTLEMVKSSTLNLGDFQIEMQDGALVRRNK